MEIGSRMTTPATTIDADASMKIAVTMLERERIRQLPVVKDGRLVGIVTDRDLRRHAASDATALSVHELNYLLDRIKVRDVMTANPISIPPNQSIEEAAMLLRAHKIGALPVVEDGAVVGIITATDILDFLIEVLGMRQPGGCIEMIVEDRPGCIHDVGRIIQAHGANMVSVMTSTTKENKRVLIVKVDTIEFDEIAKDLEEVGLPLLSALV